MVVLPHWFVQYLSGATKALWFFGSSWAGSTELIFLFLETIAHIASTITLESFSVSLFQQVYKVFKAKYEIIFCVQSYDSARLLCEWTKRYVLNG